MNTSQEIALSANFHKSIKLISTTRELTIKDLLAVLRRRRLIVLWTLASFVSTAILICAFSTRRYLATGEIQVQKDSGPQLGLDSNASEDASSSDALQDNITLQTQANILQSDSLALKVIHDLNLASTTDFEPTFSPIGWVLGIISPQGPSDAQLGPSGKSDFGMSPRQRIHVLTVFSKNLSVKPISGTRLIEISYLSSNPRLAAEVVNHLADGLNDYNFQTRHDATARTVHYLTEQLTDLRKQSEDLQANVARAQRESGILSLGGVDAQGRDQVYSAVLDKLQQATAAYTQAQSNRIAKEAVYEAAKTGDPEAISTVSSVALTGSSDMGLALIQSLRLQQTNAKSQLAEASAKFGKAFPKLLEMQQQIDTLNSSITTEVARLADRTKNDAEVARDMEQSTRKVYLDLRSQADALNDKTIAYTILRQEAEQSRTLYETLFKQLKQAGVLTDFKISNTSVVDPARVPAKPAKPNVALYLAASMFCGFLLGCGGAYLRDTLDTKIHSLPELEAQLGQLPLGVLPYHDHQHRGIRKAAHASLLNGVPDRASSVNGNMVSACAGRVAAINNPRSPYVEALRALRTSILLSRSGTPPQLILVTSSVAAEGKSMLSLNLATLLAQQNKKVLLIDGDFRQPTLHRTLNIKGVEGLSSFLAGHSSVKDPSDLGIALPEVQGLTVLPAGPVPPYPAELLGSHQMSAAFQVWRNQFEFVIVDGAPVLPVTDSVVLSTMVDFTLLIARYEVTHRQSFDRSYGLLESQIDRTKIGVVLNAVNRQSSTYYQYYGFNDSKY